VNFTASIPFRVKPMTFRLIQGSLRALCNHLPIMENLFLNVVFYEFVIAE